GAGTRMTLRVPLTLTIIPALTVSIGSQHFAIPRAAIEEIVRANGTSVALDSIGGAGVATIRGRRMPEISLADVLGLASDVPDEERTLVVLRPAGGDLYALAVDRIHDHEELVVKPAAPAVMATGLYAGTTLADDGSPILLFDPAGVAEVGGVKLEAQERAARIVEAASSTTIRDDNVLLFRGLDGNRRAIRLALVDRIEEVSRTMIRQTAGQLRVQLGDLILPLAGADALGADWNETGDDKVRVFRLSDGSREIGYVFRDVIDLMTIDHDIIPAEHPGAVSGVSLIGGEPAELVDPHWLFAAHLGATARAAQQPVCRLPSADPWMQNMLRPIVEAAGYLVIDEHDEQIPDVVIAAASGAIDDSHADRTLVLRDEPHSSADDGSIYRYDRAGLLSALKAASGGKSR
ncbi:MAG: chemotaxis protein CheW, partial [Sphingomonas bacterium]|nr:chemotaxis protein CheW [Sphingomonas bacterium]